MVACHGWCGRAHQDLIGHLIGCMHWRTALALRAPCRGFNTLVLESIDKIIGTNHTYVRFIELAVSRQVGTRPWSSRRLNADLVVRQITAITPYNNCWEALSDPKCPGPGNLAI